jgi:N-acetylglutamate synthase-like GNAT family acetyltransferase
MIEVVQLNTGNEQFLLFKEAADNLYSDALQQQRLVSNIRSEFLHSLYIVKKNSAIVGRAALYNNPSLVYENRRAACIGNYECMNDDECANQLLQRVVSDARQLGTTYLIGPMNGSTWDDYRFSIHHHHPVFLLEPYHHLYYNNQFIQFGFQPIASYISNIDHSLSFNQPAILRREEELTAQGLTIRRIDMNHYEDELRKLYPFICTAFATNFLYTPVSEQAFISKYKEAKEMINPAFVLLAEDKEGAIIGFIFCYHDLYNKQEKNLVVKTVARNPSAQWKGLGHVLGNRIMQAAVQQGFKAVIHAFVIEQGTSVGLSDSFLGNSYKNYILYGKEI